MNGPFFAAANLAARRCNALVDCFKQSDDAKEHDVSCTRERDRSLVIGYFPGGRPSVGHEGTLAGPATVSSGGVGSRTFTTAPVAAVSLSYTGATTVITE